MPRPVYNPHKPIGVPDPTTDPLLSSDLHYTYPEGLDLRPKSKLHRRVVAELMIRMDQANGAIQQRHSSWQEVDRVLSFYVDPDLRENLNKRAPTAGPIKIVYPYSYAAMDTLLSYLYASIITMPIIKYTPIGPDDAQGAALLELVIDKLMRRSRAPLALHTAIRDNLAYGLGIISPQWAPIQGNAGGTIMENISPYNYLPDPNCPVHRPQQAEYLGWVRETNYYNLLTTEKNAPHTYFNGLYVKALRGAQSRFTNNRERTQGSRRMDTTVNFPVYVVPVYVKLIPQEWGLGPGQYPETWLFELAQDSIIIRAQRTGIPEDKFPIAVGADNFDGYSFAPMSRIEAVQGLQTTLDWLLSSHITDVRSNILRRLVVNPKMIVMDDLEHGRPFVRLREAAYNMSPREVVHELTTSNVTQQHLRDTGVIINAMQQVMGTDSAVAGELRHGGPERLTSVEARQTHLGAMNRYNRIQQVLAIQLIQEIGEQHAHNTMNFLDQELWLDIPGRYQDLFKGQQKAVAGPDKLRVGFDVFVDYEGRNGLSNTRSLQDLAKLVMSNELLAQIYDLESITDRIFRREGIPDIADLKIMPDDEVLQQTEKGNLAPL